jgi:ubiquinone/menaquinone biosynthesis C-methylase UbiE
MRRGLYRAAATKREMKERVTSQQDYVLGTHDQEITRLGLQHRVWRPRVLAAWQSAEIGSGQTVLDVGCGPGYASLDLAELVGPSGVVVAIDKSDRFLEALDSMRQQRGIGNVTAHKADLDAYEFPAVAADRVWCRWVLAFVKHPRDVLTGVAAALKPDGVIVLHEYFDYSTWRAIPPCGDLEEFVAAVMASWRDNGGEPDIGLWLPGWLEELGFELRTVRPIVDIVQRDHMIWSWLRTFLEVGRRRLVDLGYLSARRADSMWEAFSKFESTPGSRMITPAVLEIVAARRAAIPKTD